MALLLNIDTATEQASVCISRDGSSIGELHNNEQKSHATFLQPAIERLLHTHQLQLQELDAVAVTAGPGSYTGLRVGLASAKGLCYALQKPLLLLNTLQVMAVAAKEAYVTQHPLDSVAFCPMIDARRMEVFTALYNASLEQVQSPEALVLEKGLFEKETQWSTIVFSGNGSEKFQPLAQFPAAHFSRVQHRAAHLAILAEAAFLRKEFANLAYCEPFYLKEFFSLPPRA